MKKHILCFTIVVLFFTQVSKGQTFTMPLDTVFSYVSATGTASILDDITNISTKTININWKVSGTTFPPDWLTPAAFGICDNSICRYNSDDMQLWNDTTNKGKGFTTNPIQPDSTANFSLSMDLSLATSLGTYSVNITLADPASFSPFKTVTFILDKTPAGVSVIKSQDDITLYPNPANDNVNVFFNADSKVKNIAIYNIIGKVMAVYRVTANNSANLNVENIPSGIYFVRFLNSYGSVVATRKFTKQ